MKELIRSLQILFPPKTPEASPHLMALAQEIILTGLGKLQQTVHGLSLQEREASSTYERLLVLLLSEHINEQMLEQFWQRSGKSKYMFNTFVQQAPQLLQREKILNKSELKIFHHATQLLMDTDITDPREVIKKSLLHYKGGISGGDPIFEESHRVVPNTSSAELRFHEGSPYIDLHINILSLDERIQATRLYKGFQELRLNPPDKASSYEWIRGVSWLARPSIKKTLAHLGITEAEYSHCDTEQLLSNPAYSSPTLQVATTERLVVTAARNIGYSQQYMREFLQKGILPDVGVIMIPTKQFFIPSQK